MNRAQKRTLAQEAFEAGVAAVCAAAPPDFETWWKRYCAENQRPVRLGRSAAEKKVRRR